MHLRKEVYTAAAIHKNITLLDFSTRFDWMEDPKNYKDIEHYSPNISREMLRIVGRQTDYVEDWDIELANRELGEFLRLKHDAEPECAEVSEETFRGPIQ